MIQFPDDALEIKLKRLKYDNKRLKDISLVRKEKSSSILKNCVRMLFIKLGQVWDLYNGYTPFAIQHNEIYRNILKEMNKLAEDEDI